MGVIPIGQGNFATRFYYKDRLGKRQRVYQSGFKSKREALKFEVQEKERLEQSVKTRTNYTLTEFIDELFLPSRVDIGVSIATLDKYSRNLPRLKQGLGHLSFTKINEDHCQAFLNKFRYSPAVQNEYRKILNAIFNYGKFKRMLRENPMDFVSVIPYKAKKIPPYTFEDFQNLLAKLKEDKQFSNLYTPVVLACFFAATREEVCALLETDLDDTDYSIKLDKAYIVALGQRITGKQKTENRNRVAFADKFIFDEIRWYKRTNNVNSDYVCVNQVSRQYGEQMQPNNLTARFKKFINKHKMKKLTFHKIRNSFGNMCKAADIDPDTVFRMFGHANYKTTVDNYNSGDDSLKREAVKKLSSRIFNRPEQPEVVDELDLEYDYETPIDDIQPTTRKRLAKSELSM